MLHLDVTHSAVCGRTDFVYMPRFLRMHLCPGLLCKFYLPLLSNRNMCLWPVTELEFKEFENVPNT